jgi:hypothetical protein
MAMSAADDAALDLDLFGPVDDSSLVFIPHSIWYLEKLSVSFFSSFHSKLYTFYIFHFLKLLWAMHVFEVSYGRGGTVAMDPVRLVLVFELLMPGWLTGAAELAAQRFLPTIEMINERLIVSIIPHSLGMGGKQTPLLEPTCILRSYFVYVFCGCSGGIPSGVQMAFGGSAIA